MRFFTYREFIKVLKNHGFAVQKRGCTLLPCDAKLLDLKSELLALKSVKVDSCDLDACQWEFIAEKPMY